MNVNAESREAIMLLLAEKLLLSEGKAFAAKGHNNAATRKEIGDAIIEAKRLIG